MTLANKKNAHIDPDANSEPRGRSACPTETLFKVDAAKPAGGRHVPASPAGGHSEPRGRSALFKVDACPHNAFLASRKTEPQATKPYASKVDWAAI